jgi:RNA polymerase sigma factor for flagellar operon FliA
VHQGLLGLISAVDRYDPSQGTRFSTYAGIRIKGKILDYLRSGDWMSRSARRRVKKIQEAVSAYWGEHQREPTDEELAHTLGMDVKEVQQGLTDSGRILLSLDSAQNDAPDRESLYETEADDNQTDPGELLAEADMKQQMAIAIRKLSEREQLVLSLYYFEELNFKEVGKVLNISESRACQLHARALINLKALINHGE